MDEKKIVERAQGCVPLLTMTLAHLVFALPLIAGQVIHMEEPWADKSLPPYWRLREPLMAAIVIVPASGRHHPNSIALDCRRQGRRRAYR